MDLPTEEWVAYCFGVGEDATFDVELVSRFGCKVHSFDPTPASAAYMSRYLEKGPNLHFHAFGIWSRDEVRRFFVPRDPTHISHSITNLQATSSYFVAECKRLATIMDELHHRSVDLIKMDIEGAEYATLNNILDEGLTSSVLCVEFHAPWQSWRGPRLINRLKQSGYALVAVDGWNYTFVHGNRPQVLVDV